MSSIWHFPPNSMSETLEFVTDIRRSRSAESRDSYKDATQRLVYGYTVDPSIAERMIGFYRNDSSQIFRVPEWPTATIGSSIVITALDTTADVEDGAAYQVGQEVMIGIVGGAWEVLTVDSIASDQLTFTTAAVGTYTGSEQLPAFIVPMINAFAPNGLEFAAQFPVRDLSITFLSLSPVDLAANPYATFETIPVVDDGEVAFSSLAGRVNKATILVDSMFGAYELAETEDFVRRFGTLSFFDETYADRFERRRFFHFMRGRDGEMWVPTGQADIELNAGFSSAALSFNIVPFADSDVTIGQAIRVSENGNTRIRKINSVTVNSPTSWTVGFTGSIGFTGTTAAEISLLTRSRFDTDQIAISYQFTAGGLVAFTTAATVECP